MSNIFKDLGVVIKLAEPDDFLKVRETLTRMGIASKKEQKLFQSCHILHKRGEYAILHFKEMFIFDGKGDEISLEDIQRRNTIVKLLEEWKLVEVVGGTEGLDCAPIGRVKIIPHKQKGEWVLEPKYSIGNPRNNHR